MFERQYDKDQPIVKNMAMNIAANGTQFFESTEGFVGKYGDDAAKMFSNGGLIAALWEVGVDVKPASFTGAYYHMPKGLKIQPRSF